MNKSDHPTPAGGNGPLLPSWLVKKDVAYFYRGEIPFEELQFPDSPGFEDADWALTDPEIQEKYHGLIVAVHNRKVWGAGPGISAALAEAHSKPGCPPEHELSLVWIVSRPLRRDASERGAER